MGGFIAQELALKYPQRLKSLMLAATGARRYPWAEHVSDTWVRMAQEGISMETRVREMLPWVFTDKFFENEEQVNMTLSAMLSNPHPRPVHGLVRQVAACVERGRREPAMRDRIGQITAPTLVLVGKEDILLPVKLSEELAAGIPNAELVVLEGGAHGFNFEIPDKFNQAVLEFLAKVEKGG